MKKHTQTVLEWGFALGFALTLLFTYAMTSYEQTCEQICEDTIRLHVLANSDSVPDQMLKLHVRDAVLQALPQEVQQAQSKEQALEALHDALPALHRAAQAVVQQAGSGQTVKVSLVYQPFEAKQYDGFSLPAGDYTALRVELGAAKGHNWFCVLYPSLCLSSTARYASTAENAVVFGGYELHSAVWDSVKEWAQKE